MTLKFSPQQDASLRMINDWYRGQHKTPFVLNCYAGTGKTTIARYMPELIGASCETDVIYAAYTGKAALQLRSKGCTGAMTLHKLLYKPQERDKTRLRELAEKLKNLLVEDPHCEQLDTRVAKQNLITERRRVMAPSWSTHPDFDRIKLAKMIVVDESSMVDEKIHQDLMSLGLPIIYCGDPFQLPPVRGKSPVSQLPVNITLTEVHRQALENPVLRVATDLRDGGNLWKRLDRLYEKDTGEYHVISTRAATYETYRSHDQVLCGRNKTRSQLNIRTQAKRISSGEVRRGDTENVGVGDRIVFLRNDYDADIFNGSIGSITEVMPGEDGDHLSLSGTLDEGEFTCYEVWQGLLMGEDISGAPRFGQAIDLAYALTVHKAQGSEWDSVLVQNEPLGHGTDMQRWLYTAITRARTRCTVVMREEDL